jgi:receptor expression-enhancing protein 5/6
MLPQTRGAKFLYDSFLKDFLLSTESKIDKAMNTAKTQQQQVGGGGEKKDE